MENKVRDIETDRNLVRAINENETRLVDLRYALGVTKAKRENYINCKAKCNNLKNWLMAIGSTGLVLVSAAAISVGIANGHGAAGNAIMYCGLLALCSLPIIYNRATKRERKFIKTNNYTKLRIDEYKLQNAVQRREERKTSLRAELNSVRGIVDTPSVDNNVDKVVGVNKELAKQK